MPGECSDCKVSFGPSDRYCPRCGQFEMPAEDRIGYLSIVAETAFEEGATLEQVEAM